MWVTSKPKSPRHPIQARPELPRDQSCYLPNSCPARSYWSSRLPREPERNTRHQRSGSATATSKIRKETWLASDQPRPTDRHDTHLKLIWKRFEWKQVKQTRPGHITNNQTEVKQATSTQRKHHHTCDTSWCGLSLSQRAQDIRNMPGLSSRATNLIIFQIHVPHGAIDLQGVRESLKETQDIKDPGQQLQQVKWVKRLGEVRCKGNMGKGVKVGSEWS